MEEKLKHVSETVENWIARGSNNYKILKYIIENGNEFIESSDISETFPEIKAPNTILYDLARRGAVYNNELKHRPILVYSSGLGYRVREEFKELIKDLLKSENQIRSNNTKNEQSIFREKFVEEYLANWFKNKGYKVIQQCVDDPTKFKDIFLCKTHSIWGIDLVAQNPEDLKEKWIIEVKGEDKGGSASGDVNWTSGLGQLLINMKSFDEGIKYGIALPYPSTRFIRSMKRTKDSKAIQRLGINIFLIKKDREVIHIAPEGFPNFIEKL